MTYIGVPLIVSGLIIKNEDDHFQSLRNTYIPNFRYHYDDYLQYLPAVAMLGLKIGGVQGRSSWSRMLVSEAITASIMGATINTVKHTANVTRPDGSNNHSFPSGHTAMAFMAATMLHKEYGTTRSPWYSIGGYTVATATAVSRMLNSIEGKGLITRTVNVKDRRNTYVCLTPAGEQVLADSTQNMEQLRKQMIQRMGHDDVCRLIELWNKLAGIMEDEVDHVLRQQKERETPASREGGPAETEDRP